MRGGAAVAMVVALQPLIVTSLMGSTAPSLPTAHRSLAVMLSTLNRTHDPVQDGDAIQESFGKWYKLRRPQSPCRNNALANISHAAAEKRKGLTSPIQKIDVAVTCADLRAARTELFGGVQIVMGISTAPDKWGARRRDGIRQTWLRWPSVGYTVVSCFVLGRRDLRPKWMAALDAEQARNDDIAWLNHTVDGKGPFTTITKVHHWFRLATELLGLVDATSGAPIGDPSSHSVKHIAKVDDDTFLNLPVLQADLAMLGCVRNLYYGVFAFGGYNPRTFLKCGFDYSEKGNRYRRYGCAGENAYQSANGAAHPPFPFTCGSIMLASTPLIVRIAIEPAIHSFVRRSESGHNTDEDVALGFWLSRYHLAGDPITYVRVNERLSNLACFFQKGLYKRPTPTAVGSHFVKTAAGMRYVWGVIHDGKPTNATLCRIMTGDGRL